jgi:hypothetical protein
MKAGAGSGLEAFTSIGSASRVLNIISSGLDAELYLTFTFEWDHPDIEAGSEAALQKQKEYQATAPRGVAGTLAKIRAMVKEGKQKEYQVTAPRGVAGALAKIRAMVKDGRF